MLDGSIGSVGGMVTYCVVFVNTLPWYSLYVLAIGRHVSFDYRTITANGVEKRESRKGDGRSELHLEG